MNSTPLPDIEAQRLTTLMCLRILDTPPEERFDQITRLVAAYFAVPIAAINLIDADRQWTKSDVGLVDKELPRNISFCAQAIVRDDVLLVPDTFADDLFRTNPLVTSEQPLRFYAGVPLHSVEGYALGTLCIADYAPRTLDTVALAQLRDFAAWAERELTTEQLSEALLRQQETEDALRLSESRYQIVLAALSEGIVFQDAQGVIQTCNASAERILGLSIEQMMGRTSIDPRWQTIHEDGTPFPGEAHPAMIALRTGQLQHQVIMGVHKPDETLSWIAVNAQPLCHPDELVPYGVVCSFTDITAQKHYEQQLKAYQQQLETHNASLTVLATTDSLTGIANKRMMFERLAHELDLARHTQAPLSLILLDVDHFKSYNDTFGHPAGDLVLGQVAQILTTNARTTDLVARYGGEEFVLILPNTDREPAGRLAERLRTTLAESVFPYRSITASFGVATSAHILSLPDELLARADAALYTAKGQGRNRVAVEE